MPETKIKPGFLRSAARFLFSPAFIPFDMKRYRSFEIPDLPDAPVPPLRAAADLALALRRYEERNEKLDLPALRGWSRLARALPKPRA